MAPVASQLDFTSELFSPVKALSSKRIRLPYPNSKTYDNLSEYYAYTFGKKGSHKNEFSNSKRNECDRVPERNYSWYYATLGLEYSEDEEIAEHFSHDGDLKSSVALPNKQKLSKSLPNKREKSDFIAPLRSSKVIVSEATNSGQCKKYLCYAVKNVRKRLYLRQTIDSYFEKQTKTATGDSASNSPNNKKNDAEFISESSGIKRKRDSLNDSSDSETSDDSQSQVAENEFNRSSSNSPTANNHKRIQTQKQLKTKSVNLVEDEVDPRSFHVMNQTFDIGLYHKPRVPFNSHNNSSPTNDCEQIQSQFSRNLCIKTVDFTKEGPEDLAEVLKSKANTFGCHLKTTGREKISDISKNEAEVESCHKLGSASNSQRSLPALNNDKVLLNKSPKQLPNKVDLATSVKPTRVLKSRENDSNFLIRARDKENMEVMFCSSNVSSAVDSIATIMKSNDKVKSTVKNVQINKISCAKKQEPNLLHAKPNKDLGLLKSKVKSHSNQENNALVVKKNFAQTSLNAAGTNLGLKYGAIIPDSNKLRGYKIPLKRQVLSEISN